MNRRYVPIATVLTGGGHVVTIVITNENAGPITDATAFNHYSLLRSLEVGFRLPALHTRATPTSRR
ncbi:MAG TPA: hypothetical protein VMU09_08850 [Acidimicrobiales bacterium]|nr:hypothetical protein [Acidimicrobiales bacterium]